MIDDSVNITNDDDVPATDGAKRDTSLDMDDILKTAETYDPIDQLKSIGASVPSNKDSNEPKVLYSTPYPENEEMTPLEKLKAEKANTGGGIIVSNEDVVAAAEKAKTPLKNVIVENEKEAFDTALFDVDLTMEKRKRVVIIQPIDSTNRLDVASLMDEIESVKINSDGTASIDYKDAHGNPATPRFIRLRTENDPSYEEEEKLYNEKVKLYEKSGTADENGEITNTEKPPAFIDKQDIEDMHKRQLVEIIIDKTGLGTEIDFTEEEREKIARADEILLKTVELKEIPVNNVQRSTDKYKVEITETNLAGGASYVPFIASGFKAQMRGLSYGEMNDLVNTADTSDPDKFRKRLTVIYDKMINPSCGPFDSFNDFMHKFAYTDIESAIYGILVSTFPEVGYVTITCPQPKDRNGKIIPPSAGRGCGRSYQINYQPRSIFSLDTLEEPTLNIMKDISAANDITARRIAQESAVRKSKFIELPNSKYIAEVGIASAYQFMVNMIPALDPNYIQKKFGIEDGDETAFTDALMLVTTLGCVLSFKVPKTDENGNPVDDYVLYDDYDNIIDIITMLPLDDMRLIMSCYMRYYEIYNPQFLLKNITCPHCGFHNDSIGVVPSNLLFQMYQRQLSTTIDVSELLGF